MSRVKNINKIEFKKLTTKRLLKLYKSIRSKIHYRKYIYCIVDEDFDGNPIFGWENFGRMKFEDFNSDINYFNSIKEELDIRENV